MRMWVGQVELVELFVVVDYKQKSKFIREIQENCEKIQKIVKNYMSGL